MAKTRSLPDKFYDKDYEHNGIHRVPLWRIAGYALNNTATNVYLMMMNYATYYLMGWVGHDGRFLPDHDDAYVGRCYRPVHRLHGR